MVARLLASAFNLLNLHSDFIFPFNVTSNQMQFWNPQIQFETQLRKTFAAQLIFCSPKFILKCNYENICSSPGFFGLNKILPFVEIGQEGMFKGLNHTQDTLKICCAPRGAQDLKSIKKL